MSWNRYGLVHAMATCVVGVMFCLAAPTASALKSTEQSWGQLRLDGDMGLEVRWFLLPDAGPFAALPERDRVSALIAQVEEGPRGIEMTGFDMGLMTAVVPSTHGVAEDELRYTFHGPNEQWTSTAKANPLVVENYGAVPDFPDAIGKSKGKIEWVTTLVAGWLPTDESRFDGVEFRLTELSIEQMLVLLEALKAAGVKVQALQPLAGPVLQPPQRLTDAMFRAPQPAATASMGGFVQFTTKVANCLDEAKKSTKPVVECYNLFLGRDSKARWFEELHKSVENDRYEYGPFVDTPIERANRGWMK